MQDRDDCNLAVRPQLPENEMALISGEKSIDTELPGNAPPDNSPLGDVIEQGECAIQIPVCLRLAEALK